MSIVLPTVEGENFYIAIARGKERDSLAGERVPMNRSIVAWVARNLVPVTLQGVVHDPRFAPIRPRSDIRSAISVPMLAGGKLVGVLNVNATERRRPFGLGQLKALTILASTAASALERAYLDAQVRRAEKEFRSIFENAVEGIYRSTPEGRFIIANPSLARIHGYDSPREMIEQVTDITRQLYVDPSRRRKFIQQLQTKGIVSDSEGQVYRKDGSIIWISETGHAVYDDDENLLYYEGALVDITTRKRAQEDLRASEARFRGLVESAPDAMVIVNRDGRIALVNSQAEHLFGYTRDELRGQGVEKLIPARFHGFHMKHRKTYSAEPVARHMGTGLELFGLRRDGAEFPVEISLSPIETAEGMLIASTIRDATERKQAEEALRQSENRYRRFFEGGLTGIYESTSTGQLITCNQAFADILGFSSVEEALCCDLSSLHQSAHAREAFLDLLQEEKRVEHQEFKLRQPDGSPIEIIENVFGEFDQKGTLIKVHGFIIDNTERKRLIAELRQSQKMEAIGRLAGGIAPDFNNLLSVIMGYSELLLMKEQFLDPQRKKVEGIHQAGARAASLTRQLLAFSRSQVLEPQEIDMNALLTNLDKMLRRLVGEDIEMQCRFEAGLGRVWADPGQIEQVVMNMVVNAQDARPQGGKLTIETGNVILDEEYASLHPEVNPGPYVLLAISDTGDGMDEWTQTHIFDPFFTTKEKDKGTGLGLSTVYGIVKQSGGHISVRSELMHGTTFKIYLPLLVDRVEKTKPDKPAIESHRGSETILVVEDQEGVRTLACEFLAMNGYTTLEAKDGVEAIRIAETHPATIHLLLTDVVMPGMSGRELVERFSTLRPDLKVLYMTGYTDDAIVRHGVLDTGVPLLAKPFSMTSLARKVREVLSVQH